MSLNKINLRPDSENYAAQMGSGVLTVQLDGGAPRTRLDLVNQWAQMNVQWTVDGDAYAYLRQCNRYCEVNGGAHFLLDLVTETGDIEEHECMFVPGTFALTAMVGVSYVCKATIMVKPLTGLDNTWPADSNYQDAILGTEDGDLIGT